MTTRFGEGNITSASEAKSRLGRRLFLRTGTHTGDRADETAWQAIKMADKSDNSTYPNREMMSKAFLDNPKEVAALQSAGLTKE
jgi:hypothetical protein